MRYECEVPGCQNEATGHTTNPEFSGYFMCDECIQEYDSREPLGQRREMTPAERLAQDKCYEG